MLNTIEIGPAATSKPLVEITPEALKEIKRLLGKQSDPEVGLRLGVRGGGCAGLNYDVRLDKPRESDRTWQSDGVTIMIDRKSAVFLIGSVLEYSSDLLMGGFKFSNPNASRSCGCGTSFSV